MSGQAFPLLTCAACDSFRSHVKRCNFEQCVVEMKLGAHLIVAHGMEA